MFISIVPKLDHFEYFFISINTKQRFVLQFIYSEKMFVFINKTELDFFILFEFVLLLFLLQFYELLTRHKRVRFINDKVVSFQ